jgi:hypothetical protein
VISVAALQRSAVKLQARSTPAGATSSTSHEDRCFQWVAAEDEIVPGWRLRPRLANPPCPMSGPHNRRPPTQSWQPSPESQSPVPPVAILLTAGGWAIQCRHPSHGRENRPRDHSAHGHGGRGPGMGVPWSKIPQRDGGAAGTPGTSSASNDIQQRYQGPRRQHAHEDSGGGDRHRYSAGPTRADVAVESCTGLLAIVRQKMDRAWGWMD